MSFKYLPLLLALGACSVAPDYVAPEVAIPERWNHGKATPEALPAAYDLGWREFFQDAALQNLIATALEHNADLKKAASNVQAARAQYAIQDNLSRPTIGANGSASRSGNSDGGARSAYQVGLGISNFELDFFGKTASLKEQALQRYLASEEARAAAQLSVIAALAQTYYQALMAQEHISLAEQVVVSREESYRLSQMQYRAGLLSEIALRGVESAVEQARSSLIAAQRQRQQAINALALLVGRPVQAAELSSLKQSTFKPLRWPQLPGEILQRRPDIRQAEHALQAAQAQINVARATMYPSLSLTSTLGLASNQLKDLFSSGINWNLSSNLTAAIFDRDSLHRNVHLSEAQQQAALADYQKAIQSAFYEIANLLFNQESLQKQWQSQEKAHRAVQKRLRLEEIRFRAGVSSALELLDAQRESFAAAQALLNSQLALLQNQAALYIALGGGLIELQQP